MVEESQEKKGPAREEDPLLTPEDIGLRMKLHPSQIRRMFAEEPGVINVALGKKNKTLRIPMSVYRRVLRRRAVAC